MKGSSTMGRGPAAAMPPGRLPRRRTVLSAALLLGLATPAQATVDPGRSFANEIGCGKASGLSPSDCRRAFALARAEYLNKTRSYPSRFACYRAYGPCSPWPVTAGIGAHFRPQFMGVTLAGPAEARTVLPLVAAGKAKLTLVARSLSDPLPIVAEAAPEAVAPALFTGGIASEVLCRQISDGAAKAHLPPNFLARLLWQESSFRPHVVSRAGALGIAQFMPGTALERGLDDPFDPARAIETSAALLGDLAKRFGNLGLAAAAYNGGPARVDGWLQGRRSLAAETEAYVRAITGRSVQDWAGHAGPDRHAGPDGLAGLPGPCAAPTPQAKR
ncbi:lytic transglycosylase domain-containing protein [Lichenihabitans sp. Uapishka_5]|uniref:lytic transglycosylase domain-containing protein n=1 Tax=Lichenihabitans sp. Uapishka_5 TaxID=3037302 RepID=UPI003FA56F27